MLGGSVCLVSWQALIHVTAAPASGQAETATPGVSNATANDTAWQSGMPYGAPDPIVGQLYFIQAKGKSFLQGSPPGEPCRKPEEGPQFTHTLGRDVAVMETEVTRQMWADLKARQPAIGSDNTNLKLGDGPNNPVQRVSWYKALLFANLLSLERKLTPVYYTDSTKKNAVDALAEATDSVFMDPDANGFRLPTEGEFEYFDRAGSVATFAVDEPNYGKSSCDENSWGVYPDLDKIAWFIENTWEPFRSSRPVGLKAPNRWGLRDTHGNIFEFTWDRFAPYPTGWVTDYQGPASPSYPKRVGKGGSWYHVVSWMRPAFRSALTPGLGAMDVVGFRLVRTVVTADFPLRFSQFGQGQGFASDLVLANPSPSRTVTGSVSWTDGDGLLLPIDLDSAAGPDFSIPPLGVHIISAGGLGNLRIGSAVAIGNGRLSGVVRFSIPGTGIAGVGSGEPLFGFIAPVRRVAGGINTGLAVSNMEDHPGRLILLLRNLQGQEVAGGAKTITGVPASGHLALFINELFPEAVKGDFQGTLTVESVGGRVVATVLELGPNPGEFTTLPVIPLPESRAATDLHFAQFGSGQGFRSDTVLVNPRADRSVSGTLSFSDDRGDPMAVGLAGAGSQSSQPFTIPPLGALTIATNGSGALSVGSARATADGPLGGVVRFTIPGRGIAGVGASSPMNHFLIPVRRTAGGLSTGIALRNTGNSTIKVDLTIRDRVGAPGTQVTIDGIAARGHRALLLEELFPEVAGTEFEGSVSVRVTGGMAAATALELGQRTGEFTTLPVTAIE